MSQTIASGLRLSKLNSCRPSNLPEVLAFAILCVVGVLPLQGQAHENWSGWSSLGQILSSDPAVARNNDGKLEVFFRSSDNQMNHSKQVFAGSEAFDPFTNLEDGHLGNPVTIAGSDGRLWVFVRGANGKLWRKFQQGAPGGEWSGWEAFPDGALLGDPAVVVFQGRLHVFVRGTDNPSRLYYKVQWTEGNDSSWSGWISLGGVTTANPAAVAFNRENRLEVFVRGSDGGIYTRSWSGAWSGWGRLGTLTGQGDPAVASNRFVVEVVARGNDGRISRIKKGIGWSWGLEWTNLGGPLSASDPTLAVNGDERMEIFIVGNDGNVHHNYHDFPGGSFTGFHSLAGFPATGSDIAVATNSDGRLQIFVRTGINTLEQRSQVVPGG